MSAWLHSIPEPWFTALSLTAVAVGLFIFNRLLQWCLNAIVRRGSADVRVWSRAILESVGPPMRAIIWLAAASVVVNVLTHGERWETLEKFFPPARNVVAILAIAWFSFRFVGRANYRLRERASEQGTPIDATAADAVVKLLRATIIIITVLVAMQTLGFSIGGLLAFGGAAGIALGFAAQSLVANLLGGLTIFASRVFKIGEYIILPNTTLMGEVQHIGWRATRVLGFDCKPFYIPNATFNTTTVINHSRMTNRRIMEDIYIRFCDVERVRGVVDEVNALIAVDQDIDHSFYVFRFDSCGVYGLKLFLYAFTIATGYEDYMAIKERLLLDIAAIIKRHDAALAVPLTHLYDADKTPHTPLPSAPPTPQ